jgi:hypothetical protein
MQRLSAQTKLQQLQQLQRLNFLLVLQQFAAKAFLPQRHRERGGNAGYKVFKVHDFRVAWFWNLRLNTRLNVE